MRKKLFTFVIAAVVLLVCFHPLFAEVSPGEIKTVTDKISLDVKGMDVVDVLKMLADKAWMNLAIGKNVNGKVTLFLKDVNPRDAFEIVLLSNELASEEKNGIVNVMSQKDYELLYGNRYQDQKQVKVVPLKYAKAAALSSVLNQIKSSSGKVIADDGSNTLALIDMPGRLKEMEYFIKNADLPTQTRVFNLNYAQADKISAKLQEIVSKASGSIRIDERTNKIAVTDYPHKLEEIAGIIKAFDEKTPQVLIDAQVIEVKPSDKFEMGVDWDYWIEKNFRLASAMPSSAVINKLSVGMAASGGSVDAKGKYKGIVDLLRTIGDTKILSSPRIMAINNQEAKILVGTKDAYITSSTSQGGSGTTVTSQSVNFVDVGIKLYVTPTISPDGFVTLKIKPEISSSERTSITSEGKITQIPIVTTSEAETTVMVKDGITIIIGGLRKDERKKEVKKIPLIGDIPLVGFFFRSTSDETKKTELVILLTPHIMSGEYSHTDFSHMSPKDGMIVKMANGNIVEEKTSASMSAPDAYSQYYKYVIGKIMSLVYFTETKGQKGKVEVFFGLNSKGKLTGEPKIISSTNLKLNRIAAACIKSASPFQPFPEGLNKEEESFNIELIF